MPNVNYIPTVFKSNYSNLIKVTSHFSDNYRRVVIRAFGFLGQSDIIDLIISLSTSPGDVSFNVKMKYVIEPEEELFKLYEKDKLIYLCFTSRAKPFTGFIQSTDEVKNTGLAVDDTYTEVSPK